MKTKDRHYWIGFDLGGTKMLSQVFDAEFFSLGRARTRTKGHEGAKAGMNRIIETIRDSLKEVNMDDARLAGIGIGCPGTLDIERGIVLEAANLGWDDVPVRKILEQEFGCPVVVSNDVDAGVYGEYRFGACQNARTAIGVFPGTGIGGGCVYDGKLLTGRNRTCMEVGHIQVVPNGLLCGCGRRGCLETVASRLAISAAAAQAAYRGDAPYLMEKAGTDLRGIRSRALADSIAEGDKAVEIIVNTASVYLGQVVGALVNLLAPDQIVLGGGLVEAMPDIIVNTVTKTATKYAMPSLAKSFRVVPAKLGDDATAMGAAAWAQTVIEMAATQV